jgi:hypothetical protein
MLGWPEISGRPDTKCRQARAPCERASIARELGTLATLHRFLALISATEDWPLEIASQTTAWLAPLCPRAMLTRVPSTPLWRGTMRLPVSTAPVSRWRLSQDFRNSVGARDQVNAATFVDQKCLATCQNSCDKDCSDLTGPARGGCLIRCRNSCTKDCTRPGNPPPPPPPPPTCTTNQTFKTVCWPIPLPPGVWCWQEQDQCTVTCCTPTVGIGTNPGGVACTESPC